MEEEDNIIMIVFAAVDCQQQDNKERLWEDQICKKKIRLGRLDWKKKTFEEIRLERYGKNV